MRLFKRREATDPPYLRRGEEALREAGWTRVGGEGAKSVWTRPAAMSG
jgi:hypothetical protein